MNIEEFAMIKKDAKPLWKEYTAACKKNPKDKFLKDMKAVYNQLKCGRKVIDIYKVFERATINHKFEPKLAIALATNKTVYLRYYKTGRASFRPDRWGRSKEILILPEGIFPKIPDSNFQQYENHKEFEAPVPAIPASIRPKGNLDEYYVLWEVEEWKPIPPKDPYLLRRLTNNMFVVVAAWNLTELERSVMRGRVW